MKAQKKYRMNHAADMWFPHRQPKLKVRARIILPNSGHGENINDNIMTYLVSTVYYLLFLCLFC